MRCRWRAILIGLPLYLLTLMVAGTAALGLLISDDWGAFAHDFGNIFSESGWWMGAGCAAAVVTASQAVFLLPVFQFRRARIEKGKSLACSAALLGVLAAALTVGLIAGLTELFGPWGDKSRTLTPSGINAGDQDWFAPLFWSTLITSWIIWSIVLFRFTRRTMRPENRLGRLIGILLGGTVIEALVILPIDIMVRRRTDCYCNTGTFFTLGISIVAAFWLAGPGLYFVLTSKRRRAWYQNHCESCGYNRGPTPGEKCPECGFAWGIERVKPQAADR